MTTNNEQRVKILLGERRKYLYMTLRKKKRKVLVIKKLFRATWVRSWVIFCSHRDIEFSRTST